ncbi:RNA polymerase sigma factor [Segeticoccus rhizosphaerae]|uniref:RNA polymerase sigma factor n=1 Tax=Segeticoccus rhizosphaerae TaxID=1104777 RepID=UPI0012648523|nr:sigma-70 family RNA polymerase sigma factor [Segeticoccus rhizosphaerae]
MPAENSADDPAEAIVAAWRAESARLVGALTRMTRDVELAEDLAQDALVSALEQWPTTGVPKNPIAWLMTIAKRRGIDHFRRADSLRRKIEQVEYARGVGDEQMPDLAGQVDYVEDDVLRLIFLSCHPCLTAESRAALTLRLVGGLTTAEIARGFLVTESTMGQRISRAKKTLSTAHAEFELPTGAERARRLDDVMAVIYLIFNEGYTATSGEDWMRPDLASEATRLARVLVDVAPHEPEVLGLQALLELQGSRMAARLDEHGTPVLLEAQDRTRWDPSLIRHGMAALEQAERLAARGKPVGKYFVQALIAAQHARAKRAEDTDWRRIAALYDVLADAAPGPVVEVNRAVAHGRAFGPDAGLAVLEGLDAGALGDSPLVPSVRGDLLERAGLHARASEAFAEAVARTRNEGERTVLQARAELNLSRASRPTEVSGGEEPACDRQPRPRPDADGPGPGRRTPADD